MIYLRVVFLLGLGWGIIGKADIPKSIDTTILGEDVSNAIFQLWYENKDIVDFYRMIDGYINKTVDRANIYLETSVSKEDEIDIFPEEVEDLAGFISSKVRTAEVTGKVGKYSIFVDSRTRCFNVKSDKSDSIRLKCKTRFSKKEFAERLQKMQEKEG